MVRTDIKAIRLEELITYSKQKEASTVTIIDDVSDEDIEYIEIISERLNLIYFSVKNTNMIAFISNTLVALKIAKNLHKRSQTMYYNYYKRPSSIAMYAISGYTDHWIETDKGYEVEAYDEKGDKTETWINTDIKDVEPEYLNSLKLNIYSLRKDSCRNLAILEHSIENFLNDGIYNEERKCYYPIGNSNKDIAEYNKLEKLFKQWGFKSL